MDLNFCDKMTPAAIMDGEWSLEKTEMNHITFGSAIKG